MTRLGTVVSVHNKHDRAFQCIESIADQQTNAFTVIVDDASSPPFNPQDLSDDTVLYTFLVNRGVQCARNCGWEKLRKRRPECVLFCDGDVIWKPGAFQKMDQVLKSSGDDVGFVYSDYDRVGVAEDSPWHAGKFSLERLRLNNFISTMSLIKASVLEMLGDEPFKEDEDRLQDWSLWLRICNLGFVGEYISESLFTTYFDENSISRRGIDDYMKWYRIMRERYVI